MSKFNFFVSGDKFLELPKHSWNLQMLGIIEKFRNWKIVLKTAEKLVRLLTPWYAKFKTCYIFNTLARQAN